jgi:phosphatidylserine/phosphatidylglycerophosphate/cardiolipin synthase-like enzyme
MINHKMISILIISLMFSGIIPFVVAPGVTTVNQTDSFAISQSFEWQTFNRDMNVTTFVSPDGSHDELWHILQSAEQSIYVEIYGINNPYLLDLIHELRSTKPALEMKFLLGWNSLGYYAPNDYVANNLTLLGYPVKWTGEDNFTFAHQKFLIVDNKTTVVHAGNWAKTSFPEDGKKANREWSIAMTNVDVTSYYRSVFDADWHNGTVYDAGIHGTGDPLVYTESSSTYSRPFSESGHFSGPMNVTPILSPDTSLEGILYCINAAQVTLDIQIPYFTNVGDAGEVDQIIDAILAAKNRGVTVRVITEEEKDFQEIADILHNNGIPIVWQDSRWFTANHNKGIIVDGRMVLISSINYSEGSISRNREAGVIIENKDVAQWYLEVYDFDWSIGDCDVTDEVNLYWDPNIPTNASEINVTVYGHMLYGDTIDEVELDVKIGDGAWSNITITANVSLSAEGDEENFFYVIPAQPDGTNITIVGRIRVDSTWHTGIPMVIRVRNDIGYAPTTTAPPPPPPIDWYQIAIFAIIAISVIVVAVFLKKSR